MQNDTGLNPDGWRAAHPDLFFLDPEEPEVLERWLGESARLDDGERVVAVERAGEGNMNCTVRARTSLRSLVVKQARPWVEKYPQFAAPRDRALREIEFYRMIASRPDLASRMPRLVHADPENRILVLEDLGKEGDYSDLYGGRPLAAGEATALADWLGRLHQAFQGEGSAHDLCNREMRSLNSGHIFFIPLEEANGLDLEAITPGLAQPARRLKEDRTFVGAVHELAELYLADGPCLLHGDFFPGSFLRTASGPAVIDPEFAFFGRPEWDPAVFVAHLLLAGQTREAMECFLTAYRPPAGFDETLLLRFAGVEVMRRLIGYAQLPLQTDLAGKRSLLRLARELVLEPSRSLLERR